MDTIFAVATAAGRAGVSVIRLSGPSAFEIAEDLTKQALPKPRYAVLREVVSGDGAIIDTGLVLRFDQGRSFTGEDVVEFQMHGSPAGIQAICKRIGDTGLARQAEPGEFTKRALMNGQMDLTQVEGLNDLLAAETQEQHRIAQAVFGGKLRETADKWYDQLLRIRALIEAAIDFADEDIPADISPEVCQAVSDLTSEIETVLRDSRGVERLKEGFTVALTGEPNVGKSTLLNHIAGREIALTSDIPGTTRDVIECRADIRGLPVTFLDTAGVRETEDDIEKLGVALARSRASQADIRVHLLAGPSVPSDTKTDLYRLARADVGDGISGKTGNGVAELLDSIADLLLSEVPVNPMLNTARQRDRLSEAVASLQELQMVLSRVDNEELAAEYCRQACDALSALTGRIETESVLGEIFSAFCIGK